jgi:L-histidine Nalpha-methyltransferase
VTSSAARRAPAAAPDAGLLNDVLDGLSAAQPRIAPKYFYDERGAALFERICELDEYYLTRTELDIMRTQIADIARAVGPDARVVELGSGAGLKTRLLLRNLQRPREYIPVDIAAPQLQRVAASLREEFPALRVTPFAGDYSRPLVLPQPMPGVARTVAYFPGSTIGNFEPDEAVAFLRRMRQMCGAGGALLLGTDMHKDTATLERAYNDSSGVTAEFNLNLLARLNRELGADFDLDAFEHRAVYDELRQRIEMRLVGVADCAVTIDGRHFTFRAGEHILTEYSHKYTLQSVQRLASLTGWQIARHWSDAARAFTIWLFRTR